MSRIGKSARGQIVDFDLLEIKQQMTGAPKTLDVSRRESFIDAKMRRKAAIDIANIEQIAARVAQAIADEQNQLDLLSPDADGVE